MRQTSHQICESVAFSLPFGVDGLQPAICAPNRPSLTYFELTTLVRRIGNQLRAAGIGPDDRVALFVVNGPDAATAFLSIANACQCVPLNPTFTDLELIDHLSELKPKLLIHSEITAPAAAKTLGIPTAWMQVDSCAPAGLFSLPALPSGDATLPVMPPSTALLLHTSGTSARPKLVPLSWDNLRASAANISNTTRLTADDRCLNVLSFFHVAGLVSSLLATLHSGGSVVCTPGFVAPLFFDWLDEFEPTWFTAVPVMHQAILDRAPAHADAVRRARSRLRLTRTLSAPIPEALQRQIEATFGVPLINTYGMTEGAGQLASTALPPAVRKPGSVGQAAGPEIAILDADGNPLPPGQPGEICVRGRNIMSGYVGNAAANSASFFNGWLRSGDLGYLDADGFLFLSGRVKELINRGGEKISPTEIDAVLNEHPAVQQCVSFAVPDSRLGEDIAALVITRPGAVVDEETLQHFAASRLASYKVPRRVFFVDNIPKTHNGKIQRIGLAARLGITTDSWKPSQQAPVSTDASLTGAVARVMAEVLAVPAVEPDVTFFDAGADSLLAAQFLVRIESEFGKRLSMVDLFNAPSARAVAAKLASDSGQPSAASLASLAKPPCVAGEPPFLCIGAGPIFRPLAQAMGTRCPFESVPTPNVTNQGIDTMEQLAARVVPTIQEAHPNGPLIIAGWSLAGVVAIEVAAQLERAGRDVQRVVLFDSMNPVRLRNWFAPAPRLRQLQLDFIKARYHFEEAMESGVVGAFRYLARTVNDARARKRYDRILRNAAVGKKSGFDVPLDFRFAFGPYAARYAPAPLRARMILVRPERRKTGSLYSGDLGWAALGYTVEVITVPGDHDRMFAAKNAPVLAERLLDALDSGLGRRLPDGESAAGREAGKVA